LKNSNGQEIVVYKNDYFENKEVIDRLPTKNTLFISSIPKDEAPDANTLLTKVVNHFQKFGEVKNVLIRMDKLRAYVQFERGDDANKAVKSPDAVMGNRFIQVQWCQDSPKRPGQIVPGEETIPMPEPQPLSQAQTAQAVIMENRQKQEKLKTIAEINKKKEEMLRLQLTQMNMMIESLQKLPEGPAKVEMAASIKKIQEQIDAGLQTQKENMERAKAVSKPIPIPDKKDVLDRELDQIVKSEEGEDSQTTPTESPPSAGRGGFPLRGRGAPLRARGRGAPRGGRGAWRGGFAGAAPPFKKMTLDNRTATVAVRNVPEESRNEQGVRQHFEQFGAVESVAVENDLVIVKFASRPVAERVSNNYTNINILQAITQGKTFNGTPLAMQWKQERPVEKEEEVPVIFDAGQGENDQYTGDSDEEEEDGAYKR
jgi:RNA recognition motif-containing protein